MALIETYTDPLSTMSVVGWEGPEVLSARSKTTQLTPRRTWAAARLSPLPTLG
jgi:hypothetical protein